jgi:hypothetical protein
LKARSFYSLSRNQVKNKKSALQISAKSETFAASLLANSDSVIPSQHYLACGVEPYQVNAKMCRIE